MSKSIVQVSCHGNRKTVDPRTVRRRAERILTAASDEVAELSVLLCDDPFIRTLNSEYRGIDKATDVLSFSMREGSGFTASPGLLGDVVVSVETAARRTARAGTNPIDEVTTLLIHGILHLLGHDHKKLRDAEKMRREEARIAALL
jgi:probable rRNA maturation factor